MTTELMKPETNTIQRPQRPMSARGVMFTSVEDLWSFAGYVSQSGLAPKGMEKREAIVVAIQMGLEVGLSPMASLQNIAVINGRPSLWGDAMLAVCRTSGVFCEETFHETVSGQGDERKSVCTVRRLPSGKPCVSEFSVADAKRAGLWGKQGPWSQYPDRMLKMRARSFALRDTFGDSLRGMYSAEEVADGFLETVRNVDATVVRQSVGESIADELRARLESKNSSEPVAAGGGNDETTEAGPVESAPTENASEEASGPAVAASVAKLLENVAKCTTLTQLRTFEDDAAKSIPMPDRQTVLNAIAAKTEEIRYARGKKPEGGAA